MVAKPYLEYRSIGAAHAMLMKLMILQGWSVQNYHEVEVIVIQEEGLWPSLRDSIYWKGVGLLKSEQGLSYFRNSTGSFTTDSLSLVWLD